MKKLLAVLVVTGTMGAGAQKAKAPDSVQMISPIFHQLVAFSLPTKFDLAARDHVSDTFYIREAPLRGESVERWTQLITVNGFRGAVAKGVTAQRTIDSIASHYKGNCPASFAMIDVGGMQISKQPAYLGIVSCGSVADTGGKPGAVHSETALIVAIAGDQDVYTLQWAERGAASAGPLAIEEKKWQERFKVLNPIRVCPLIGEKEPYPSCLAE